MKIIETLRTPKILDMAIFDWVGTFVVAFLVFAFTTDGKDLSQLLLIFTLLIGIGVITHKLVKVDTKFNYYLGLGNDPRPIADRR
jgi:glycerol uptake facilitator-like aquaporin